MTKEYGIKFLLEGDGSLSASDRMAFISLATYFENDFRNNLKLTSLELDEKYSTSDPGLWQKFLNHRSIRNYIDEFLNEEIEKQAKKALASGSNGSNKALKVMETMDKKRKRIDNSNIIVMLLPEKEKEYG